MLRTDLASTTEDKAVRRKCAPLAAISAAALFAVSLPIIARAQQPAQPAPPADNGQSPQAAPAHAASGNGYAIQRDVNLVVLHISVVNNRGVFVPGLKEENFKVFEAKAEQKLSVFRQEDLPVSMGLVIDNSGSMQDKRPEVTAAALTLVKASNPQDEAFVVNFNEENYLDTVHGFTSDIEEMKDALERVDARGMTALYDAVVASLDHLKKGSKDKKVLLVVTDGVDNASRRTLQDAVEEAQRSDAVIYTIGLFGDDDLRHRRNEMKKARRALTELATATGGVAFFPGNVGDTQALCTQIAHDIRDQYTLAYYPTNTAQDGTFRSVQVQILPQRGTGKLTIRTRTGYYAHKSDQARR